MAALGTLLLWLGLLPPAVFAHGTDITLSAHGRSVTVHALFDTGEPMSNAQVAVYAADNPRQAWLRGETSADGVFTFDVDPTIAGQWAISVRTAGHGEIVHFDVAANGTIVVTQAESRSRLQTWLLAGGVVLALGGVAWFFSRPQQKATPAAGEQIL